MALPIIIDDQHVTIGASVGIAIAPTDGTDGETLLKKADLALYRAKSEGRGTYHFFEKGMDEVLQRRRALEQGMKVALSRGEFRLVYQPLLSLADSRICCFEALLRWDHPERGLIMPGDFIPVAEETGIIAAIGEWVLRDACQAAALWPEHIRIAVNLSPVQFKNRALVNQVHSALHDAGIDPGRLELEITESLLLADTPTTLDTLHRLRALGVRIAMDDFGTGLFLAELPARLPLRQDQDRPIVHGRAEPAATIRVRSSRRSSGSAKASACRRRPRGSRPRNSSRRSARTGATKGRATCSRRRFRFPASRR